MVGCQHYKLNKLHPLTRTRLESQKVQQRITVLGLPQPDSATEDAQHTHTQCSVQVKVSGNTLLCNFGRLRINQVCLLGTRTDEEVLEA